MEQKSSKLLRKKDKRIDNTDQNETVNRSTIVQKRLIQKKSFIEADTNKLLTSIPLSMQNTMNFIDNHNKHAKTIKHENSERRTISDDDFFNSVSRLTNKF